MHILFPKHEELTVNSIFPVITEVANPYRQVGRRSLP